VLRVSIVRIELCSTRTIGRSAWSGILKLGGDVRCVVEVEVLVLVLVLRWSVRLRQ
jgi:hypothetical protein